jgi:hypothetical protein
MTQIKKCWQTSSDLFYALIAGVDLPTPDGEQERASLTANACCVKH